MVELPIFAGYKRRELTAMCGTLIVKRPSLHWTRAAARGRREGQRGADAGAERRADGEEARGGGPGEREGACNYCSLSAYRALEYAALTFW